MCYTFTVKYVLQAVRSRQHLKMVLFVEILARFFELSTLIFVKFTLIILNS